MGGSRDVVVGPDGQQMVRFHGVFIDLPGVRRGQVVQETLEHIRVLLECDPGCDDDVDEIIRSRIVERLGPRVQVEVKVVDEIPLGPGGKFQAVVSKLCEGDNSK